ncbi:hypothetical protein R1sor_007285 [Riccia sorocarpa]|uniref:Uncharacterized protein n=1 Tax=Riccia sorocarpa TaxID=122646 RepID=A0ABD3HWB5_9MARC
MDSYKSDLRSLFARQHVLNSRVLVAASPPRDEEVHGIPEREPEQEAPEAPRSRSGKRAVQNVSTKQERQHVVKWMKAYAAEVGSEDSICSLAVKNFSSGKLSCNPAKQEYIDRSIAYHLGILCRGFQSGELDENLQENADETHFVINMDNGHTLGFRGDENVKYADVVSGGVSVTTVVKVTGGRSARISSPFRFSRTTSVHIQYVECQTMFPVFHIIRQRRAS